MSAVTSEGYEISLSRTISAPPEQVFDAWLNPELLARWFAPSAEMYCEIRELDPRVGGKYHISMRGSDGETYDLLGEYVRIGGQRFLVIGILLVLVGLVAKTGLLGWFGNLPGDIRIRREGFQLFFPLGSMIVVSIVLSVLFTLLRRFL